MYKYITGNHLFKISLSGEIINSFEDYIPACTPAVDGKNVTLDIYKERKTINLERLSLLSHYEVDLPEHIRDKLDDINFVKVQRISKILGRRLKDMMFFNKPISIGKSYRLIPEFTKYMINKRGVIRNVWTGEIVKHQLTLSNGYTTVIIYSPRHGSNRNILVHRLVASAWVENSNIFTKHYVNHIDGNKTNFHTDNLEWTTISENNKHAIATGLRSDNVLCRVRNIHTGEVTQFTSVTNACAHMGMGTKNLIALTGTRSGKIINGKWEFKVDTDNTPWVFTENGKQKSSRYVITVTDTDGSKITFYDVVSMIRKYKLWNMKSQSIACAKERLLKEQPQLIIDVVDNDASGPYYAKCIRTGKVLKSDTIRLLAKMVRLTYSSTHLALHRGGNKVSNGYLFRIGDDGGWPTDFVHHICASRCILATELSTGNELQFKSLRDASTHFGVDRCVIKLRVKNGKEFNGWIFKEI